MSIRVVTVTIGGVQYEIPELWIVGRIQAMQGAPLREAYAEAIAQWIEQEKLSQRLEEEAR